MALGSAGAGTFVPLGAPTKEMETSSYDRFLSTLIRGGVDESGYAFSSNHAMIVLTEAFRNATNRVRLLTNIENGRILADPHVHRALREFLARPGAELDLLIEHTPEEERSPVDTLASMQLPEGVSPRFLPEEVWSNYTFNFILIDDRRYRFQSDRGSLQAIVAGGHSAQAQANHMVQLFEAVANQSDEFLRRQSEATNSRKPKRGGAQ